jgi:hypothetical protein
MLGRKSFKKEKMLRIIDKSWNNDLSQYNKSNYKFNIIKNKKK